MKKLLLSSIIMLGVCGIATAQDARESKVNKMAPAPASNATATPQKAASATNANVEVVNADGTAVATSDMAAPETKVTRSETKAAVKVSQTDAEADIAKKKEMQAAQSAAPATKKDN